LPTVNELEGLFCPKSTAVAPDKFVPVIVTNVPLGPELGLTPLTAGGGGTVYVNWAAALVALVPPSVATVTSTVPTVPGGAVAVMLVEVLTVYACEGFPDPKSTLEASDSPAPVIVTTVPPVLGPEFGLIPVRVGTDAVV